MVKRKCFKVTLHHPWLTPEYRERCRNQGSEVLAADIPFPLRFMFDKDLQSCFTAHGEEIKNDIYSRVWKVFLPNAKRIVTHRQEESFALH
jgi:DNA polymerase elongation subunit (family B)